MQQPLITPRLLVADLLAWSPLIAPLLVDLRVDCPGCAMNKFCTLEELCRQYEMDLETVIVRIQERLNHNASH